MQTDGKTFKLVLLGHYWRSDDPDILQWNLSSVFSVLAFMNVQF